MTAIKMDINNKESIAKLYEILVGRDEMLIGETPDGELAIANLTNEDADLKVEMVDDNDNCTTNFFSKDGLLLYTTHNRF